MKGFLRYGDSVVFYGHHIINSPTETRASMVFNQEEKEISGFLSTKGYPPPIDINLTSSFMSENVYFQTIKHSLASTNYRIEDVTNFRDCVFKITPKLKHESNRAYKRALKEFKRIKIGFRGLSQDMKADKMPLLESFERKVQKAKERALEEKNINLQIIEEAKGTQVAYGNEIQLMHRDSEGFLIARDKCSKTEQIGNGLEICYNFSNRMLFTLNPRYKTRKQGDLIQYTDKIIIKSTKKGVNISVSPSNFIEEEDLKSQVKNPFKVHSVLTEPNSVRHEMYLGENGLEAWEIMLFSSNYHSSDAEAHRLIEGYDLIRIKHSEFDSYLSASVSFEFDTPEEVYFRRYNGAFQEEETGINDIWEIAHHRRINQGTTFQLPETPICLRNFNTGKKVMVTKNGLFLAPNDSSYENENIQRQQENEKHSIFNFTSLQVGVKSLIANKCYKIASNMENKEISGHICPSETTLTRDTLLDNPSSLDIINEYMFTTLEEEFYDEEKKRAVLVQADRSIDSYQIIPLGKNELREILFLRSILDKFNELASIFKNGDHVKLNNQLLVDICDALKRVICFIHNKSYDPNENYEKTIDGLVPVPQKQKILKDLGFLDILIDLIHMPFTKHFYNIKDVHKILYMPNVLQLSYNCFRSGIMEYRPSELYASQWLDLMIHYFLSELDASIGAKETLTELIDNNQRILETRIKRSTIDEFVKNLIELGGDIRYTEILRAMCICDGKPMLKNQNAVTEAILQEENIREKLILPLQIENGVIQIATPWVDNVPFVPLKELHIESDTRDSGKYYTFYCSLIYLLGDLCQERNYAAIEILRSYFSVSVCQQIITEDVFRFDLKAAFCRLMENLWINVYPFIEIKIPSNVKNWKEESSDLVIKEAGENKGNIEDYQDLTKFVFAYIGGEDTLTEWEENGYFVLEIVQICTKMLHVGFFGEFEVFSTLNTNLQKMLNKTDEIIAEQSTTIRAYDDEKSRKTEDGTKTKIIPEVILQIKIKILMLFQVMKEVQSDLRLNKMIQYYKEKVAIPNFKPMMTEDEKSKILESEENVSQIKETFTNGLQKIIAASDVNKDVFIEKNATFVQLLLQQSIYSHNKLKNISISLLHDMFQESDYLKERIEDIQIIDDFQSLTHLESQEEINRYLFRLAETIEVWQHNNEEQKALELTLLLQRLLKNMHEVEGEDFELETDHPELKGILKDNCFLGDYVDQEMENISSFSQDLLRNTGCLESVLEILKSSVYFHKSSSEKFKNIPCTIYLLLAKATFRNQKNQTFFSKSLDNLFLGHLKESSLKGRVCVFLSKLIENNSVILKRKQTAFQVIDHLFQIIKEESESLYLKAYALHTASKTVFFDLKSIKAHQNQIISKLVSSDLQESFKSLGPKVLVETIKKDILIPNINFVSGNLSIVLITENLCLDLAYIDIITKCSFNKNTFAENISHSLLTTDLIKDLINMKNTHPLLTHELYKMIYHVYISTKTRFTTQIELFLMNTMLKITEILEETLDVIIKGFRNIYFLTHKELVPLEAVYQDTVNVLLFSVEGFIEHISRVESSKVDSNIMKIFITTFVSNNTKMIQRLKSAHFKKKIQRTLHVINSFMQKNTFKICTSNVLNSIIPHSPRELDAQNPKKTMVLYTADDDLVGEQGEEGGLDKRRQLMTIFREQYVNMEFHKRKSSFLMEGDGFKQVSSTYFNSLQAEEFSNREIGELIILSTKDGNEKFKKFLHSLIEFLNPENKNSEDIIKIGLKIFQEYLNHANGDVNDAYNRSFKNTQRDLKELGIVELICKIIPQATNPDILEDCIDVANSLLDGGTSHIQDEFLSVFQKLNGKLVIKTILREMVSNLTTFLKRTSKKNTESIKKVLMNTFTISKIDDAVGAPGDREAEILVKIFSFFKNLCEGHNLKLQNYLRNYTCTIKSTSEENQEDEKRDSENIISLSPHFFGSLVKFFNSDCSELVESALDFMIESVQGPCKGNQKEIINCNILTFCKDFLNELNSQKEDLHVKGFDVDNHMDLKQINLLFSRTINLLQGILELNNDQETLESIGNSVKFRYLSQKLLSVYSQFTASKKLDFDDPKGVTLQIKTRQFDEDLQEGFGIYGFIQTINDSCVAYRKDIIKLKGSELDAYTFFKVNSGEIELVFGGELQRVYFMIHPACNYLPVEYQKGLMNSVGRDNSNQKLSDFLTQAPRYYDLMDHTFNLENKYYTRLAYLYYVRDSALFVAIIINLYIFVTFEIEVEQNEVSNDEDAFSPLLLFILGCVHIILSMLMIFLQLVIRSRIILIEKWRLFFKDFRKVLLKDENVGAEREQQVLTYLEKDLRRLSWSEYLDILALKQEKETGVSYEMTVPTLHFITMGIIFFLRDFEIIYFIFYSVCSLYALLNQLYLLYSIFLFEIIFRFDTMRNVIRSVTYRKTQLILTGILGIVIVYIYTLFGYYFLIDTFWNSNFGEEGENQCTSVLHCFLTILSLGPRSSGGIGDMMVRQSYSSENRGKFFVRYIFDVTCFFIVNIIWMNINFGLIIDTFAMLRDQKTKMEEDQANVCFICSLDRQKVPLYYLTPFSLTRLQLGSSSMQRRITMYGTTCSTSTTSKTKKTRLTRGWSPMYI